MVKKNYAAWHIRAEDFSHNWSEIEKLLFFARYSVLAPSGHNTQPWHFSHLDNVLILRINAERYLPYSGTQAAEPFISLGACIETLILAAKGFGYSLNITYEFKIEENNIISIRLGKKIDPEPSLLNAIIHRTSNRHPYNMKKIEPGILDYINNASGLDSISGSVIVNKEDIKFISLQTVKATHVIMSDPLFRQELSKWVRNNMTRKHDGMPGYVQGIPTPPSMIAKHVIKNVDISKGQAKKDSKMVLDSPAVILISANNLSENGFLNAGRFYARICILAKQKGLDTSGIGAAVIDPDTKKAIAKHFRLQSQPIAMIRVGKAKKRARHTPRWPINKVID